MQRLFGVMTSFATLYPSSTSSQCVRPLVDRFGSILPVIASQVFPDYLGPCGMQFFKSGRSLFLQIQLRVESN
jgi:hypothetical protein